MWVGVCIMKCKCVTDFLWQWFRSQDSKILTVLKIAHTLWHSRFSSNLAGMCWADIEVTTSDFSNEMRKRNDKEREREISMHQREAVHIALRELLAVTPVFWAANTFPNQKCGSYCGGILKLLHRNFCGPAHKSAEKSSRKHGRTGLQYDILYSPAQHSAALCRILWKHMYFTFTVFDVSCCIFSDADYIHPSMYVVYSKPKSLTSDFQGLKWYWWACEAKFTQELSMDKAVTSGSESGFETATPQHVLKRTLSYKCCHVTSHPAQKLDLIR